MEKQMLINALHSEEIRIAIVEDKRLSELEIESLSGQNLKGNIYKTRITRVEPSLQAAFIDLGTTRNGFLQINDVHPAYYKNSANPRGPALRTRIQDVLSPGQEIIVQVVKEEREMKGATLTTYLSLAGRYLVLMPGSDRGGVSRRIVNEEQRTRLKKLAQELEMPAGIGVIVRTAGLDRSMAELSRDLSILIKEWEQIVARSQDAACPSVLYQENDLATRVMRDYFTPDIREVVIDDQSTFERVREFVSEVMPRYRSRIKLYNETHPIFSAYNVDRQVEETLVTEVKLKSGGSLVIEPLEALVAIDVNSGKATQGGNIEETAYRTNLEAADEIARQLRLRDLGGLIVLDFIDMSDRHHKTEVENRLKQACESDKARVEIGKISKFGLLEMSRQRLRASLNAQSNLPCQVCQGTGRIKNTDLVALDALRKIQSAIIVGHVSVVKARLSPAAALFLLNNKRSELSDLEKTRGVRIYILADGRLRPDEFHFEMEHATQPAKPQELPATLPTDIEDDDSSAGQPRTLHGDDDEEPQRGLSGSDLTEDPNDEDETSES